MKNKEDKKTLFRSVYHFFDKFEDHNRAVLSHYPIVYAIIGGFGVVQYWRGVWHLADEWGMSSWASLLIGLVVMLASGLLVSFFIGDNIILTGLRREKKLAEKTEEEVKLEESQVIEIKKHIDLIEKSMDEIKAHIDNAKKS